jgi:small RNA 2'-O-methyltransferase
MTVYDLTDSPSQHELRLSEAEFLLSSHQAKTVLDLGCGPGDLVARLQDHKQINQIVGVDVSAMALSLAREKIKAPNSVNRISLIQSCITDLDAQYCHFDAAILLEVIEHIWPNQLSAIEHKVFHILKPRMVIITTPNKDYNPIHGLDDKQMRHPDHKFEWSRQKFKAWCQGICQRSNYLFYHADIGECHFSAGSSSQMALFSLQDQ